MMNYEIGFDCGMFYSVNMFNGTECKAKEVAEAHARRHGYTVEYIRPISALQAESNKAKGMPFLNA